MCSEVAVSAPRKLDGPSGSATIFAQTFLWACNLGCASRTYHPAVLLKLFIYGYLSPVPSSRGLEREAGRNVEVMWLTGRLVRSHETIAISPRQRRGPPRTCTLFVELCRRAGVLKGDCIAVDGSKVKAVNGEALDAIGPS